MSNPSRQPLNDITNLTNRTPDLPLLSERNSGAQKCEITIPLRDYNEILDRVQIIQTALINQHREMESRTLSMNKRIEELERYVNLSIQLINHTIEAQNRSNTQVIRLTERSREFDRLIASFVGSR